MQISLIRKWFLIGSNGISLLLLMNFLCSSFVLRRRNSAFVAHEYNGFHLARPFGSGGGDWIYFLKANHVVLACESAGKRIKILRVRELARTTWVEPCPSKTNGRSFDPPPLFSSLLFFFVFVHPQPSPN